MSVKKYIKRIFSYLGFEIINRKLLEQADDPYFVLSKILKGHHIKTIIDAGASIGSTSLKLANLFPEACVHAVEPYHPFYKKLSEISKFTKQIKSHQLAFAEKCGSTYLNINKSEGTNSLLNCNPNSSAVFGNLLVKKGGVEVKTETIDKFLQRNDIDQVDILKLDLQGYELFAIEGCSKSLQLDKINVILCEVIIDNLYENQPVWSTLLDKLVRKFNFTFFDFYQPHYHHGQLIQFDALFIHSNIIKDVKNSVKVSFHPHSKYTK